VVPVLLRKHPAVICGRSGDKNTMVFLDTHTQAQSCTLSHQDNTVYHFHSDFQCAGVVDTPLWVANVTGRSGGKKGLGFFNTHIKCLHPEPPSNTTCHLHKQDPVGGCR